MRAPKTLETRIQVALLQSERALGAVLEALTANPPGVPELRSAVWNTVAAPDAHAFRDRDIDAALTRFFKPARPGEENGPYTLEFLRDLANEHLFFDGDRLTVRPKCFLGYMELIAHVEPAFLIGSLLAERLQAGEIEPGTIESLLDVQCPLGLPRHPAGVIFADNHVHLGGVSSITNMLLSVATGQAGKPKKWALPKSFRLTFATQFKQPELALAGAYRKLFSAVAAEVLALPPEEGPWKNLAKDLCLLLEHGLASDDLVSLSLTGMNDHLSTSATGLNEQLLALVARRALAEDGGGAFIAFATLLCRLYDQPPRHVTALRLAVLGFIHLTHTLRNVAVMHGVGLDSFIGYFDSAPRKNGKLGFSAMRWLIGDQGRRAEIKTGGVSAPNLRSHAKQAADAHRAEGAQSHPWQRYHWAYHFSRTTKKDSNPAGDLGRYHDRRKKLHAEAQSLYKELCAVAITTCKDGINGCTLHQELSSRVCSFDVAGNESHAPIEVFAPALRWLRERPLRQFYRGDRLAARRNLSIHAGEDFEHLLGGLRHIDETVEFCNMGSGDRLGHGLALGLDPMIWAQRQGCAAVPLEAHFDNLIWFWHYATMLSGRLIEAGAILAGLERRISFYARILNVHEHTPDMHYRAWRLRRNCAEVLRHWEEESETAETRYWAPDAFRNPGLYQQPEYTLHRYYLYQRYQHAKDHGIITIHFDGEGAPEKERDYFGPRDLAFLTALQDYLMTDYDDRGIAIEVCPSSNLYISRINDYTEHPCMRWHPPQPALLAAGAEFNRFGLRSGPVRICINTDDPGIFPTNICAEHRLITHAARTRFNLSQTEAEAWSDHLRQTGLAIFEQAHASIRSWTPLDNP